MTITLRPLHFAIAAFVLGMALMAAVALILASGDSGSKPSAGASSASATPAAPTPTPTVAPSATAPPTAVPTTPPPPPPPPEPTQLPPEPTSPPAPRPVQPTAIPPTQAPPVPTGPSEEELEYRRRVQALLAAHVARIAQYYNTPSHGFVTDVQELASIVLNYANAIAGVEPVPPRFREARDRVVATHLAYRDFLLTVSNISNAAQAAAWLTEHDRRAAAANAALSDFNLVVGTDFPPVGGLR